MKTTPVITCCIISVFLTSCSLQTGKNTAMIKTDDSISNPLLISSTLPFHVPDFTKIKDSDFAPAFEIAINNTLAEIQTIAENADEPTFQNTLVALEKSGQQIRQVNHVFNVLSSANTNPVLQQLQEEEAPKLAALHDAMYLNTKLFKRIQTVYQKRDLLHLDPESTRLLEYYHQQFVLSGANLSTDDKAKLKKLNQEEALLSAQFINKLLEATKNGALVVDNQDALKGLSQRELKTAAQKAKADGKEGRWVIPLQNTTQQPDLQSLDNRETRHQLFEASWMRTEKGDKNDTRTIIKRMAAVRAEKAQLLGFPDYAAWNLQDQMAKTPKAVETFLQQLIPPTTSKARQEDADLQALIDQEKGGFQCQPWDWNYYAEKVRMARYDLDENEVKPYFELYHVLEDGAFYTAHELYGLTFKRRTDIPVYQEDVRVYDVFDNNGSEIGLFYCDYFKRDNKSGGAWMDNLVGQSKLLGTKPVIYNVCNFTKPAPGEPALISYDDVTTLFHEFGHALHGFFADQEYPSLSGTQVARDFVEFPSQFNEHWALYPQVLRHYAKHYKSGEPIPQALVDKIKKSATFNQGYALTELLAAAELDMQWHTIPGGDAVKSVDDFEKAALQKTHLDLPQVPPRYRSSYFMHIWGNEYAAGYYAYLWTEMLDDDAFAWFQAHGGLTRENGQRFREMILSQGNTEDYSIMFRNFCGRDPNIKPMLEHRGLVEP